MIACDIAVESVELQILTDKAGAPPLGEQVSLDTPQSEGVRKFVCEALI